MPFTLSHIAAVLPAYRPLARAHLFTAAVIGSMVPDFGLLLPGYVPRPQTHSLAGLVTFCLPMGLLVFWLTMLLFRPAILEVLPDGAYLRLRAGPEPASILSLRAWLRASVALLLGAITHLIWDAFTHENARGVRMFPLLTDYGPQMGGHTLHLWRWLQYGSSVFGLVVVAAALVVWMRDAPAPAAPLVRHIERRERLLWLCAYLLPPLLIMTWALARETLVGMSPMTNGLALGLVFIRGMRYTAGSLLFVSTLIRARLALAH
jgi:hypothetical protein